MKKLFVGTGHVNVTRTIAYVLFALSGLIAIATAYYVMSVDVLKDWRLVLPQGDIHAGDTIVVNSIYTKLLPVTGEATRYIECDSGNGFVRYELNKRVANRGDGKGGTGLELVMPDDIPNLPKTCKISVVIVYHVLPLRDVVENNETKEFQLLPRRTTERSLDVIQETTQDSQAQAQISGMTSLGSSSSHSTPNNSPGMSNTSQEPPVEKTTPEPNLLQRTTNVINNLIGGN